MAVRGEEVEILGPGIEADSEVKGSFALNMLWRRNGWEVRKGFGQVAEMDTTLGAIDPSEPSRVWGYRNHLGSYLMKTRFGHDQIISVFSVDAYTGSTAGSASVYYKNALQTSQFLNVYMVSIYDLTTDDWWEEAIYAHTSSFSQSADSYAQMPVWKGHYQTSWDMGGYPNSTTAFMGGGPIVDGSKVGLDSHQRWLLSEHDEDTCYFVEINDQLFFGNQDTGMMLYCPAVFRGWHRGPGAVSRRGRSAQVDSAFDSRWKDPYSESSLVRQATPSDGAFTNAYLYMNKTEFPRPRGGAVLMNRLVLFSGKTVTFSDIGAPTSVVVENTLIVPSDKDISAIQEHLGNLLVWTEDETWLFRPSDGFIVTTGRLSKLADGLGCLSPGAVSRARGSIFWMDRRGAYLMGGSLAIQKISDQIDPFFTGEMANPITSYYTANGHATAAPDQPDAMPRMDLSLDPQSVSSVYYHDLQLVIFSFPRLNMCLCYRDGKWAVWSLESIVHGEAGETDIVGATQKILNPWVLADKDNLYIVGSPFENQSGQLMVNQGLKLVEIDPYTGPVTEIDTALNTTNRSFYITRYGLGGALDRSVEKGEDRRHVVGAWAPDAGVDNSSSPIDSDHFLYVGKPIPIPPGSVLGTAAAPSDPDDSVEGAVWVPIEYVRGRNCNNNSLFVNLNDFEVRLFFDKTNWEPITRVGSQTVISHFLPPERMNAAAWTALRTDATGAISSGGDFVDIGVVGFAIDGLRLWERNRMMYIPFKPLNENYTVGMGLTAEPNPKVWGMDLLGSNVTADMRTFIWHESRLGDEQHQDNNVAQSVDWAYKGPNIGVEGSVQIKGRGLNIIGASHGSAFADNRLEETWPFGLMNIIGGADFKGWSSQVVDILPSGSASPNQPAVVLNSNKNTLRTRYKDNVTAALVTTTFNQADGPKYSAAGGDLPEFMYIAGDEETAYLSVSDGVRGESVSYMLWGHLQNKAERIFLQSVKAVYRVMGGKRRTGR